MKLNTTMMTAVALVMATGSMAMGQEFGSKVLAVSVPFEFHAAGVMFPAGDYNVVSSQAGQRLTVRSFDGKQSAIASTFAASVPGTGKVAKLVFTRYGDRYFLSQIWTAGTEGRMLGQGKLEREIAQTVGSPAVEHSLLAKRVR